MMTLLPAKFETKISKNKGDFKLSIWSWIFANQLINCANWLISLNARMKLFIDELNFIKELLINQLLIEINK